MKRGGEEEEGKNLEKRGTKGEEKQRKGEKMKGEKGESSSGGIEDHRVLKSEREILNLKFLVVLVISLVANSSYNSYYYS